MPVVPFSTDGRRQAWMRPAWRFSLWTAVFATAVLLMTGASVSWPPLPHVLALKVAFPAGRPGSSEPILTTGSFGNGDLLIARYGEDNKVVLAYDAWGAAGPSSAPVTCLPGTAHDLVVEMPSLYELPGISTRKTAPLRITMDGREILSAQVAFHRRESEQVYFGQNRIHGNTDAAFHGIITTAQGRRLLGGPATYFTVKTRLARYFRDPVRVLAIAAIGIALGFFVPWLRCLIGRLASTPRLRGSTAAPHGWFLGIAILALLAFTYVVTDGTFHLLYPESFGTFYDHQALSLLHGRLDVPEEALSGEAFVYQGKVYGYFGPTPALMRLPFAALGVGFGKLSRSCMVFDFALCLVAIYALLCRAVRLRHGAQTWPTRWATVVFTTTAALGSTLFYLGSRAYIYHEAILCGAAFALLGGYCTLKYLEAPDRRWWIGALACGTLAVHARPPIGLFALVLLGVMAAINLLQSLRRQSPPTSLVAKVLGPGRRHLVIGVLSVLGVLSFNALSYLKFRTLEGCPLRYNVQYNPSRLARIDGKQFHWANFHFGIDAYLLRPTLRLEKHFPYVETHGLDSAEYPEAKMDMTEEMAGLPYAMPGLCLLAVIGLFAWRRDETNRLAVVAIWVAVLPMAMAMFMAIAVAHRYTADFVPFLIMAAAFGAVVLEDLPGVVGGACRVFIAAVALLSVAITAGLTLGYQGAGVWGVAPGTQEHYRRVQRRVDSFFGVRPASADARAGSAMPDGG